MELGERRERSYKQLIDAVKGLRKHFGESQQAFATRFGLSIRSVANYEKDRKPEDRVLAAFAKGASEAGRGDLVFEFMTALGRDLGLSEIKGAVYQYSPSAGRGYLLMQFDGPVQGDWGRAFFETFARAESGTAEEKAAAQQLLKDFAATALRQWRGKK
jgi:transcriptional regulator with XRE-family HTH domain